jgi:pimeloyl-ACP methyl ester carboxylesterase
MSRSQGTAGANRGAASEPHTTQGRTQQADPNIDPLTHLLRITGPAIVVAHSWASIALEGVVKKNPDLISGVVLLEPATCPTASTINFYAKMPSLMIYGDRITSRGQQQRYNECKAAATQLGKSAQFLDLPAKGVKANGHIMMQEDNSRMLSSEIHQWAKSVRR